MVVTYLHTDGKYIKNESGQIVFLRGVAVGDLSWRTNWSGGIASRINQLASLTGGKATVVRCAITHYPEDWISHGGANIDIFATPEVVAPAVDQLKDVCVAKNLYFWTNWHGTSTPMAIVADPTNLINWHKYFANRYKDCPNFAGIEVWNEPGEIGMANMRAVNVAVYNAVRAINPNALVICSGPGYYRIEQDYISNPIGAQAVYSWDSYWKNWSTMNNPATGWAHEPYYLGNYALGYARMRDGFINNIHANANLPIINSEFGWWGQAPNGPDNLVACNDWYSMMNEFDNHWATWWWWENPSNYGLVTNNSYNTLTSYGQITANYLTGLPPAGLTHRLSVNSNLIGVPFTVRKVA